MKQWVRTSVTILDFASLYPHCIIDQCISGDTLVDSVDLLKQLLRHDYPVNIIQKREATDAVSPDGRIPLPSPYDSVGWSKLFRAVATKQCYVFLDASPFGQNKQDFGMLCELEIEYKALRSVRVKNVWW